MQYEYHINTYGPAPDVPDLLDDFDADVRTPDGASVFVIVIGEDVHGTGSSIPRMDGAIFEQGIMTSATDLEGLEDFLIVLGVLRPFDTLIMGD